MKQEGHWLVYYTPKLDDAGWHIATENTQTKEKGRVDYESEGEAREAYMGMITGRHQARS